MYTPFQLAKKYLHYYCTASNGKGHGTHSPFVFDFITKVLKDNKQYDCYAKIEAIRQQLRYDASSIEVQDFGAGNNFIKPGKRVVKAIANSSLKSPKFAQLLYRMVQYYQPQNIVELGTSFGITTAYLASANTAAKVYTCEGATQIEKIAQHNFNRLHLNNITQVPGDFTQTLPKLLDTLKKINFAFIDGNHREKPTLQYFQQLLAYSTNSTILIFDDIHWSKEMENAWSAIQQHPAVTLTIDLFFIGIVCINNTIKAKQHFILRY